MRLKTFSVTEINQYLGRLMKADPILSAARVSGEITGFKAHTSGHAYFSLKDRDSRIQCVMFSSHFQRLDFVPEDGMQVEVFGRISVYERSGQYQVYVTEMLPAGLGELQRAFLMLKERLEKEGLFAPERKKEVPRFPRKIAVITSATGAALQDVLSVTRRRNPRMGILIVPSTMQGERTVHEVLSAFDALERFDDIECIVLTRGGGSYEELAVFNDESIARRIAQSQIPVISAIGHETDFTIADFVADHRAPTPSAAAELVSGDLASLLLTLRRQVEGMDLRLKRRLDASEHRLSSLSPDRLLLPLEKRLVDLEHEADAAGDRMNHAMAGFIREKQHLLELAMERINARNPLDNLRRGYAMIQDPQGRPVTGIRQVQSGDFLDIRLHDGHIKATVTGKEPQYEKDPS